MAPAKISGIPALRSVHRHHHLHHGEDSGRESRYEGLLGAAAAARRAAARARTDAPNFWPRRARALLQTLTAAQAKSHTMANLVTIYKTNEHGLKARARPVAVQRSGARVSLSVLASGFRLPGARAR